MGGWDGIVNCETETAYVPQGISLWEFVLLLIVQQKLTVIMIKEKTIQWALSQGIQHSYLSHRDFGRTKTNGLEVRKRKIIGKM